MARTPDLPPHRNVNPRRSGIDTIFRPTVDEPRSGQPAALGAGNDDMAYALRAALDQQRLALWLQLVVPLLAAKPKGWLAWLPQWLWRRFVMRRLERRRLFHPAAYLNRYPEVALARMDPLVHFIRHGLPEKRDGGLERNPPALTDRHEEEVPALLASGMFDAGWYARRYGVTGDDSNLLRDYLKISARDVLHEPGPLFSGAVYLLENPQSQGIHPLIHYARHGCQEGRLAWTPARANHFVASARSVPLHPLRDLIDRDRSVVVLHWQQGNFFFAEIARYIAEVLADAGYRTCVRTDHRVLPLEEMEVVVVAPHEYCVHGPGAALPPAVAHAVHVNTEQWHTSWFLLALGHIMTSRRALDINPASARGLARLGVQAGFLPLLPRAGGVFDFSDRTASADLARLRALQPLTYPDLFQERPYDIMFAGAFNPRRARALAHLAPTLAEHDCFLHVPRVDGPAMLDNPNMIGSHDLAQIARHSRILLNIHQGDSDYFEWHRLVLIGIAQGCVPLTEPCADIGVVTAGEHYVAATLDEMPAALDWLLNTADGSRELARLHANGLALMAHLAGQLAEQMS